MASEQLRVALVAPPWYPVPPPGYGGSEQVVYLLARELQKRGHRVKVFASESPDRGLDLEPVVPAGWAEALGSPDQRFREAAYLRQVYRKLRPREFDVVHDHTETGGPVIASLLNLEPALVATIHSAIGDAQRWLLRQLEGELSIVAISESQRRLAPEVRWAAVVHNALDEASLEFGARKEGYLLELGRVCVEKGQADAIEVARRLGLPLVLAGKIDPGPEGRDYFSRVIEPHLGRGVTWIPNVSGEEKARLLARANAMLYPLAWEEPFGIAMIEAMGSGTPVIAYARGAAPEVVADGVTGFLVEGVDQMVAAYGRVSEIDPRACARRAREQFSPARMASAYEDVYRSALRLPVARPA